MSTEEFGTILDVSTTNVGEPTQLDAAAGVTGLTVSNPWVFPADGGLVRVNGLILQYTSADPDTGLITLATGLPVAIPADSIVELWPLQPVKTALVDLGVEESDPVRVTVPHSMVAVLADGMREPGQGEGVLVTEPNPGELVIQNVPEQARPTAETILGRQSVAPELLGLGMVGNLVQDPAFTGTTWVPPRKFSIAGPDTVYTDSNFIRATGDATANIVHDGGGTTDWDWWLTDLIPVDPGRPVRVAALTRWTAGSEVPGTLRIRVRVVFYKADRITAFSTLTEYDEVVPLDDADLPNDTWVPLAHSVLAPEGYVFFKAGVQVNGHTAGTVDFIKPEVQVLWNRIQSSLYVEGITGWAFDDENSQVANLNVLGEVGAEVGSFGSLTIGGEDLETEYLAALGQGTISFESRSGTHTGSAGITETKHFEYAYGPIVAGRLYETKVKGHLEGTVSTDSYDIRIRYTTNGTAPTTSSTLLQGSNTRVLTAGALASNSFIVSCHFSFGTDVANMRMGLFVQRVNGTGTAFIYLTDSARRLEWSLDDKGIFANALGGVLSQKTYPSGDPTPPQADPIVTYKKTFWAEWTKSYDGDNSARSPVSGECYQGYVSGTHGNTRSLVGFDYAAIQAALSGATVDDVKLTYRVQHAYDNAGATVVVSSHNWANAPGTWGSVSTDIANASSGTAHKNKKSGSTYTVGLPTAFGNELKAGTKKGIGFGPGLSSDPWEYYVYLYGGTASSSRPRLTITYRK